jgi:thiol:disulfide interchange protein DsbC
MKINIITKLLLIILTSIQVAAANLISQDQINLIGSAIKKIAPNINITNTKIEAIEPNLYKIIAGADILYISKDGRYFFYGDLIDLNEPDHNKWNLTDITKKTVRKSELSKLSSKDMMIFRPKHNHRSLHKNKLGSITVFADVSCPYSRKLHKEIEAAVDAGLEARYLFFPRAGIGSDSYKKAVSIWCAKNRKKEFSMANNDEFIPERTCKNNPIENQFNFGVKLGINATPTIILENGSIIPGFITSDNLLRLVKEADAYSGS